MSLLNNKNCAYIFDFDGVLVDSMHLHFECISAVCRNIGIEVTLEEFAAQAGVPTIDQLNAYAEKNEKKANVADMFSQYRKLFIAGIDRVPPISSNIELIRIFCRAGIKTAIASSGLAEFVIPLTKRLGIAPDTIITIENVKHGKPAPDLFLKAASVLKIDPADCIVIEDANIGVEAAYRAGMAVLRYSTPCGETACKNTTTIVNVPEFTAA